MKNIAVLISGGVDSAVVVHQLCEHGYKPDLHYIKIGMEGEDSSCTAEEDIELSQATARKYGLKLEVTDLQREYWEQVVGYAIERVRQGLTPNPDVMCNRFIKFGVFEERIGRYYDLVATGHYATRRRPSPSPSLVGREADTFVIESIGDWENVTTPLSTRERQGVGLYLGTAADPVKDQTDFLAQLTYELLRHTIFPIGHLVKEEVREIALKAGLPSARRKDSQGICFLGKIDYNDFLRKFMGEKEGRVIDIETGKVVGTHRGYWFHTIGQRKGLGLSGHLRPRQRRQPLAHEPIPEPPPHAQDAGGGQPRMGLHHRLHRRRPCLPAPPPPPRSGPHGLLHRPVCIAAPRPRPRHADYAPHRDVPRDVGARTVIR